MGLSFAFIGAYALLVGVASFVESPVGKGLSAFQLNALLRAGSMAIGVAAVLAVHGAALPSPASLLAGVGIGVIGGTGSICYCLALDMLSVAVVVACANLYIVVTVFLGIVILHEAVTPLKMAGLAVTLVGVLLLSHGPARHGVEAGKAGSDPAGRLLPFAVMTVYVILIGVSTFLEKPALQALDATQLNALQAAGMMLVAVMALLVRGGVVRPTRRSLEGALIGGMMGLGAICYFLGLQHLPVSVAGAASNAYMVVTVLLSAVVLHEALPWAKRAGIAVTLVGVTLLAYGTG